MTLRHMPSCSLESQNHDLTNHRTVMSQIEGAIAEVDAIDTIALRSQFFLPTIARLNLGVEVETRLIYFGQTKNWEIAASTLISTATISSQQYSSSSSS